MAEYRTMEEIRAEADTEYQVFWQNYTGDNNLEKVIANDHECALKQVQDRPDCQEVLLVLKGDFLVLWQA